MNRPLPTGEAYREAIAAALVGGWRFASLYATTDHSRPAVRTLLSSPTGELRLESVDGFAPAVSMRFL